MANETRVRQNFVGGLVEDSPLALAGTTLTSASLGVVPVIGTTQHYPIVLDPDGVAGAPEIVWVTVHAASAVTATIVRAQEGTTARAHLQDTAWLHGPVASDVEHVDVAPADPAAPLEGRSYFNSTSKKLKVYTGGAWYASAAYVAD